MIKTYAFSDSELSLDSIGLGDYELHPLVSAALDATVPEDWQPTGLTRDDYLAMAEPIVRMAAGWVDRKGRVIDPVTGREQGQSSPRFASPGAVLLAFGRAGELRETIYSTMDYCCEALATGAAGDNSPDFWMRELATAYMALRTCADQADLKRWEDELSAVEPEKTYTRVDPEGRDIAGLANWSLYAAGGEAMRQVAGLRPASDFVWGNGFYEKYVGGQFCLFTSNGMYRDPHDPITYDVTTRLQVACGPAFGYDGPLRPTVEELLRRGGLTTLLFASPEGFCPYGGRSAAFNFREIIIAALCELEARRYKGVKPNLAGAFKRQAHLSTLSVRRWLAMQPLRHIKNAYDPRLRHGIDTYGNYSVYSLLAASFLALAAIFVDDEIAEAPCPAELGGFAFELAPAFHKVFANCRGSYLEIDTAADLRYDATGLGRFAVAGVPLELGLGMPFAPEARKLFLLAEGTQAPADPVAIAPAWLHEGQWTSLAGLSEGLAHRFELLRQDSDAVEFSLVFTCGPVELSQRYLLEAAHVTVCSSVAVDGKPAEAVRNIVPILHSDGQHKATYLQEARFVKVDYLDHRYRIGFPEGAKAEIGEETYVNRMGEYRSLSIERRGGELSIDLSLE